MTETFLMAAGRIGVASLFVLAGISKLVGPEAPSAMLRETGLEPVAFFLPATIGLELAGGTALAWGGRAAAVAAVPLAAFTLATNVLFHDFWAMTGDEAALHLSLFFKNVAIAGALLYVAGREWATNR